MACAHKQNPLQITLLCKSFVWRPGSEANSIGTLGVPTGVDPPRPDPFAPLTVVVFLAYPGSC